MPSESREPSEEKFLSSDTLKTKTKQIHDVSLPVQKSPMVSWFQPGMLLRVALKTVISSIFGQNADFRYLESLSHITKRYFDYSVEYEQDEEGRYVTDDRGFYIPDPEKPRDDIWIDYISDTADGWNSTYAIAYTSTQEQLSVQEPGGKEHLLSRGQLLIFGGDEVYSSPSSQQYRNRLINPYGAAFPHHEQVDPHPHVFAVPGNHDWYDSLVNFTGIFCSKHWFNGWKTPQTCSYFALKLPHNWWLLGTDVQLRSDLDQQQLRYFEQVCELIGVEDLVILCNAESWWIDAKRKAAGKESPDNTLDFLAQKLLGKKTRVYLAGNQHYYRRFEHVPNKEDGTPDPSGKAEKITAGGGGAFLHPTHEINFDTVEDVFAEDELKSTREYRHVSCYPKREVSRRLCRGNLLFLWKNKSFGLVTALLYMLSSWMIMTPIGIYGLREFPQGMMTTLHLIAVHPAIVMWFVAVLAGFWFFTDTIKPRYKLVGGLVHGITHLLAMFLISWAALYISQSVLSPRYPLFHYQQFVQMLFHHLFVFIGGWIVGSTIMGVYLYISLNVLAGTTVRHFPLCTTKIGKIFCGCTSTKTAT